MQTWSEASQVLTVLFQLLEQARHFLEEAQVLLQAQLLLYLRFQNPGTALGAAKGVCSQPRPLTHFLYLEILK